MKKSLRKTGALIISMVMLLAIGGTVMADADMSGQDGVIGEFTTPDVATTQDKTVKIYKEITAYNPEDCTVNAPAITFTYTITHNVNLKDKDIWDDESRHTSGSSVYAKTKEGVGDPTITGTAAGEIALVPGTDTLIASENGTSNRFPLTIDFSGIDFTTDGSGAGVYRYQIDETTTEATKNASGIAEGAVANTLYMDVYVNGAGDVYGYVLFTVRDGAIDASGTKTEASAAADVGKTEGFVGVVGNHDEYDPNDPAIGGSTADKYYTFNLEVEKEVVNDTYTQNNHHEFPFTITLTNSTVSADVLPIMTVGQYATQTALTAAPITGTWNPTIGHTGKITYVGIPTGTTITIKETNDVTGVTYTSVSTGADTNAASLDIATGEDSNTATVNCNATALTAATENHTGADEVKFTNTMKLISPTGIIIRSAPYLLLFAAGAVLFILIRHGKKNENSEKA